MSWIVSPQKIRSSPNPQSLWMWLFGNRVFADVTKLRWGRTRWGWTLTQWLVSLEEEENLDTHTGRTPCDDGGRHCRDASRSQGTPRIAGSQQKPEEARMDSSLESSEGAGPCPHLDFSLLASEVCERLNFCCFKPPGLWYFITVALGN